MFKGIKKALICFVCAVLVLPVISVCGYAAEETELIADFNSFMTAVKNAENGDTLLVGDIDFSPLSPDVPNSMMFITVEKSLTVKSGKANSAAVFLNGGFILSGSKLDGEKISVSFENIVFDGKADYSAMCERDYDHPWSEAEQVYTYNASLMAQQALSFTGNVDADFSNCTFQNYMHEYGPVIDIRYADYTGNEYITLPDYSGCKLNLNFDNCRIEKNSALYDGGAIYIEANKNVVLNAKSCIFANNRSTNGQFSRGGGAIYAEGAELNLTDCTLENNLANHVFTDTVIPEYDTHRGGAILLQSSKLSMINTVVCKNRASMGGAISFTNSSADIDGCRFTENRAEAKATNPDKMVGPRSNMSQGGAIYIEGNNNDTVTLINSEVKGNFAVNAYGGIYGYYVPFEDPSLPTYNLKMLLCSYEENNVDEEYDYSTVGDLLWMSHPGDVFTNPHFSLFGCYIVDETFEKDFPRSDTPTADNGYNYMSARSDEEMCILTIPADEAEKAVGDRYGEMLTEFHVGSNYDLSIYEEKKEPEHTNTETETLVTGTDTVNQTVVPGVTEPSEPMALYIIIGVLVVLVVGVVVILYLRKKSNKTAEATFSATEDITSNVIDTSRNEINKKQIIKTRYDDSEIDRFISLVPQAGMLTNRELEVLREILRGRKQSEIAYYLGIGVTTVKDFYKKIYTKLNVENKDGLFVMADEVLKNK